MRVVTLGKKNGLSICAHMWGIRLMHWAGSLRGNFYIRVIFDQNNLMSETNYDTPHSKC